MRIITPTELADRSPRELAALYAWIAEEILSLPYGSQEWHTAMGSLENIRRAMTALPSITRPKPRGPGL